MRRLLVSLVTLWGCGTDVGVVKAFIDADSDGYEASVDCDDSHATVNPDATEVCDGLDNDCDDQIDEGLSETWYEDADGDGYGDAGAPETGCTQPEETVEDATDCDDGDSAIHPDAAEDDCTDPTDYNCDGTSGFDDEDGDGYPACQDCDDDSAAINPGAAEICDDANTDENCDGLADDDDPSATGQSTWYADEDADGYAGDAALDRCDQPEGYGTEATDCDDGDAAINPGASEICDPGDTDEDCDGLADDDDPSATGQSTWYADEDADGYAGDAALDRCEAPDGYKTEATDCDDGDAAINPGAAEICDAADTDEDCDGLADDDDPSATGQSTWYADEDADGYAGDAALDRCDAPDGYKTEATDCDDANGAINPGAGEICDAADIDEDCDGLADDLDPSATGQSTWYADEDADDYAGDAALDRCDAPDGYKTTSTDCDDANANINPGAAEICDDADTDEDCDDLADDLDPSATGQSTWYADEDGDSYAGDAALELCDAPDGYEPLATDCDDDDPTVHPGALDVCDDGVDSDCDGADGACLSGWYPASDADVIWAPEARTGSTSQSLSYIARVGDVDGDGTGDVLIARYYDCTVASVSGQVWLLLGDSDIDPDSRDLTDEPSVLGASSSERVGWSLAGAGDLDGDGYDDMLVGAEERAYLIYGSGAPFGVDAYAASVADATLESADPSFSTLGESFGDPAGDLDGDGSPDLALSDWLGTKTTGQGRIYLHYGDGTGESGSVSVGSDPYLYYGSFTPLGIGNSLSVGDIDGDGMDELLFGYDYVPTSGGSKTGQAWLMYGDTALTAAASVTTATDCSWTGDTDDYLASILHVFRDIDGDGYGDFAIGVLGDDDGGTNAGAVRFWAGGATRCSGKVSVSSADLNILGGTGELLGSSRSDVGDLNADGASDLAVSNRGYASSYGGSGGLMVFEGPIALDGSTLTSADIAWGWETDAALYSNGPVRALDMNADGVDDLATISAASKASLEGVMLYLGVAE